MAATPSTHPSGRTAIRIQPATASDGDFILSLASRFVECELPKGRRKRDVLATTRRDLERGLRLPRTRPGEAFFVSIDRHGNPTGFMRLLLQHDYFSGERTCHVSDLAVASGRAHRGIGHALLHYAEQWAAARGCTALTLSVFAGNARAVALYEDAGFTRDLLRMLKPLGKSGTKR